MKFFLPGKTIAVALLLCGGFLSDASAVLTTFYYDSFTRTGILNGSTPDITTNSNKWQLTFGDFEVGANTYVTTGTTASQGGTGAIDGSSYLAVNGVSGVMMNGTGDFTLSAVLSQGGNTPMGIALNNSTYNGGSMFGPDGTPELLAAIVFNDVGSILAYYNGAIVGSAPGSAPDATPATLAMTYNAALDQLAYSLNGVTFYTQSSVAAADIAALNYVSIDNASYGNNVGSFDDFTLVVDVVPEPSVVALLGGVAPAFFLLRRRRPVVI